MASGLLAGNNASLDDQSRRSLGGGPGPGKLGRTKQRYGEGGLPVTSMPPCLRVSCIPARSHCCSNAKAGSCWYCRRGGAFANNPFLAHVFRGVAEGLCPL